MRFSVVAHFTGALDDGYYPCDLTLSDALQASREPFGASKDDLCEMGDSEYDYLATESGERDPEDWFAQLQDFTVSGILDRPAFDAWIDDLGAFPNGCQTMGTLGGPLAPWGGICWDTSWTIESQVLIACVRVTPLPDVEFREPPNEAAAEYRAIRTQQRLERALMAVYGV